MNHSQDKLDQSQTRSLQLGPVESYLREVIDRDGIAFFGLIDPPRHDLEQAVNYAEAFAQGEADVILIGGSLGGATGRELDQFIRQVKDKVSLPTMLFPGNITGVSQEADALYYMSLINSSNPYWITGAQSLAAPEVKRSEIETIPTSLLVIEPGEAVGWVGEARPIPAHKPDIAQAYALAGEMLGHRLTILERGSGAPAPPSPDMFKAVKQATDHPVICAGSNKDLDDIEQTVKAGADGIHIASMIERSDDPFAEAERIISFTKDKAQEASNE